MCGRQRSVAARELGAILVEGDLVVVGLGAARLKARRPYLAAVDVSEEDVGAPVVARRVLAPPGHRQIAPAAVARARRREHHRVAAVREQVGGGRRAVRGDEPPPAGRLDVPDFGGRLRLRRPGTGHRHVTRRALLQQQLRRLDDGLGMEPRPHHAVEQRIGDGDDRHALMVRHEGPHDRDGLSFRHADRRVVQGLVEAVAAARVQPASGARSCAPQPADRPWLPARSHKARSTAFSPSPRFSPRPGTPKFEYW